MVENARILVTGGSGLLGTEFQKVLPEADFPAWEVFDVTNYEQMLAYLVARGCDTLVHAAAFTSPPLVDKDPIQAIRTNIEGTANVTRLCMTFNARLVYISTDYVFRGDKGRYTEEDLLYPVNKYAWSKLGGECAVRMYNKSLIIRTTFGPQVFPYEKAFVDQWTSRESVCVIADKIAHLVKTDLTGIIHVGGPRRTVYEYATSLDPTRPIAELSIRQVNFNVPVDTSLDSSKYDQLVGST